MGALSRWLVGRGLLIAALAVGLGACEGVPAREAAYASIPPAATPGTDLGISAFRAGVAPHDAASLTRDAPARAAEGKATDTAASRVERKLVHTAELAIEVPRIEESIQRYQDRVRELGGYLASRRDATVTCRVPAASFDLLMEELRQYGRVLSESLQARDVTEQHMDLAIRLENARKSRERLMALLDRATAVDDILKIEEQLRRLTEEIERTAGQLEYLESQIAFSTVTVTFKAVAAQSQQRQRSYFDWVNMVGAEHVLDWF
ncbi:MAG: DUF4349 domain-containing protein [Planctomycetota bacterium]